jgi:hypothetical protein
MLVLERNKLVTVQVFDKALELVAPGAALATTGNGTGVLLYPRTFPTADWVIYASGVVATGTYVLALQVSDVVGGTYTTIAQVTWPPALASGELHVPINGQMAGFFDTDSKFLRVSWTIGGTTPGIVLGSFIGKAANNAGLAVDVGDIVTVS